MRGYGFVMDVNGVLVVDKGVGTRNLGFRASTHHLRIKTMKIMETLVEEVFDHFLDI